MNQISFNSQYKYVPFLAMFYVSLALCYPILVNKPVLFPFGVLSAPGLIIPFWFIMTTIITEVYGFKTTMKLFWSTIVCLYIAAFITHFLLNLTPPPNWKGQHGYEYVLGNFMSVTVLTSIALVIGTRINAYLLARWKVLLQGKHFWLRAMIATFIGEFIFSLALLPTQILFETHPFSKESFLLFLWLVVIEITATTGLVLLSVFIVRFLKRIDSIDIYDDRIKFNPFIGLINN